MEEQEEPIDMKKAKSIKFLGIAFLIMGTVVAVFGWIVLPYIFLLFVPHPSLELMLELIIGGLLVFVLGFLLYDYGEKKYIRLKKKYQDNGGIPITP